MAHDDLRFVGARRGLEATVVPEAGFAIDLLPGRGVRRSLRPDALRENAGALWGTARAVVRCRKLVRHLRPQVVVGVGGYASLPCVLAARLRRRPVPVVVHEQNAAPGVANRVAVRLGARAAVSLPGTPLKGAVLTGNPVRAALLAVRRPATADAGGRRSAAPHDLRRQPGRPPHQRRRPRALRPLARPRRRRRPPRVRDAQPRGVPGGAGGHAPRR